MMSAAEVKRRVAGRDYTALAATFADALREAPSERETVKALANRLAYILKDDNPKMDVARFLAACGV